MKRVASIKPWHGLAVAMAILVIIALVSMVSGSHGLIHRHTLP